MLNRTSPFFSLFRASLRTLCALVLCGCCVSFLFCGCSNNDDYEIYATIHGRVTDFESGAVQDDGMVECYVAIEIYKDEHQ